MNDLSRRTVLKGMLLGGASVVSFNQLFGYSQLAAQSSDDDAQTILNLAATAETFACTHYYRVLTESDVALTPGEINILKGFLDAELQHLDYLTANGGQTLATDFYFPSEIYTDRKQFGEVTELVETTFIAAYLAATRRLAELGEPLLAATAAQVTAIEQEHLSIVRGIGGRRPNNLAFARALFYNVSEAVPALQPFLAGGSNYSGPAPYPGADVIRDLVRDAGVSSVATYSDPTAFPGQSSTAVCSVTPGGDYNANLRVGAGLEFTVKDILKPGETLTVDAQKVDKDDFMWLRGVDDKGWVRADIVQSSGDCDGLPSL